MHNAHEEIGRKAEAISLPDFFLDCRAFRALFRAAAAAAAADMVAPTRAHALRLRAASCV